MLLLHLGQIFLTMMACRRRRSTFRSFPFVPRSIFSAALQIMTAMKPSSELAAVESPIIQVGRGREEGSMDGRGKESKGILPLPQAWYPYSVVKGVVEPMKAFSPIAGRPIWSAYYLHACRSSCFGSWPWKMQIRHFDGSGSTPAESE